MDPLLARRSNDQSVSDTPHQLPASTLVIRPLLKFIEDMYDAKFGDGDVDTNLKRRVMDAQDELLPFREYPPSRSEVLEHDGPYSPDL